MPSDITTPATLTYGGGALRSTRIAPALLTYATSSIVTTRDTPLSTAAVIPALDRLVRFIDKSDGETEEQFQRRQLIWQQTMEAIEGAFAAVNARVDEVALYARLNAVEALAESANDNATAAQTTANAVSTATRQTFVAIDPIYGDEYDSNVSLP